MIRRNRSKAYVLCLLCVGYLCCVQLIKLHHTGESSRRDRTVFRSPWCKCDRDLDAGRSTWPDGIDWCSSESTSRGDHQHVIAYSLFGRAFNKDQVSRYFSSLEAICGQVKRFYPGWRIRIYHNFSPESRQHQIICGIYCRNSHVDLCNVNDVAASIKGLNKRSRSTPIPSSSLPNLNRLIWRFLPLLDPQVDRFMSRDSDAEIIEREFHAVREWLSSDYTFHVMRDHQLHDASILSGMFGVKLESNRALIRGLAQVLINYAQYPGRSEDQLLLDKIFWPSVKDDAVIHDSYNCEYHWNSVATRPFPSQRVNLSFVSDRRGSGWVRPEECPVACRPVDHPDWKYC